MTQQANFFSVVMIRHAQSEWNRQGRFTGWADPPLTEAGRAEAYRAAERLAERGFRFDQAFSSSLLRAGDTARIVLQHSGNARVPLDTHWRLNERHYGALQGKNKELMTREVGEEQVWRWRRGYLDRPPALTPHANNHPARNPRWNRVPRELLPNGESLADTRARVMPFWEEQILPRLVAGERLLIASHGNTLRALIMALQDMSVAEVESFEIPTGVPIVYAFSPEGRPLGWHYLAEQGEAVA